MENQAMLDKYFENEKREIKAKDYKIGDIVCFKRDKDTYYRIGIIKTIEETPHDQPTVFEITVFEPTENLSGRCTYIALSIDILCALDSKYLDDLTGWSKFYRDEIEEEIEEEAADAL